MSTRVHGRNASIRLAMIRLAGFPRIGRLAIARKQPGQHPAPPSLSALGIDFRPNLWILDPGPDGNAEGKGDFHPPGHGCRCLQGRQRLNQ